MAQGQQRSGRTRAAAPPVHLDALVVGAGFAGLYALHRLRGQGLRARVVERGGGVGGTWYWNRYPGARCDVESIDYSYSFDENLQQDWTWSEVFAAQPEIRAYLDHVADRFDLRRDIQFDTEVTAATWDAADQVWDVTCDTGERFRARFCIMATGNLSKINRPPFDGLEDFAGRWFHSGAWPEEGVDFTGRRVGVVGTGSTGIQIIPVVAEQAAHVTVFQRTPSFTVPAHNRPLTPEEDRDIKSRYPQFRATARASASGTAARPGPVGAALSTPEDERRRVYEDAWQRRNGSHVLGAFTDILVSQEANDTAAEFLRGKIRELVGDGEVAARLEPHGYPVGTRRLCKDSGYYEAFNRDNVRLVDLRETPLERIVPAGIRTSGATHELDDIIFATGYDAMTGALLAIDVRGREGRSLRDAWAAGPRTLLGVQTEGFPNLFFVTGPGSPSVLSNVVAAIEQHVEWIGDCLAHLEQAGKRVIEPTLAAQDEWVQHVNDAADRTLFPTAATWYVGANVPGKPRVFMPYVGGLGAYRRVCDEVAEGGYTGFTTG